MTEIPKSCCHCSQDKNAPSISDGLVAWFTHCHRKCDELWSEVESATEADDPALLVRTVGEFSAATQSHFDIEEQELFPRFESATGMRMGPTVVMRQEHGQMRSILAMIESAAAAGDAETVLEQGDTLLLLTQQHNSKEEQVLYPLSAQALGNQWEELHACVTSPDTGV